MEEKDPLQVIKDQLARIDQQYSSNSELSTQLAQFLKGKGYVKAKTSKRSKRAKESLPHAGVSLGITPKFFVPAEKHLVRYFLMDMLKQNGYDIVIHEFPYIGVIADIFAVVGGRAVEFEIKASREDYFNDFKKTGFQGRVINKHGALAAGTTMISKFYFIVPANMIDVRECPAHAGMIWYSMNGDYPEFQIVKFPALLTKEYLSPGTWQTISKRLMIRAWNLTDRYCTTKLSELKKKKYADSTIKHQPSNPG